MFYNTTLEVLSDNGYEMHNAGVSAANPKILRLPDAQRRSFEVGYSEIENEIKFFTT